MRLKLSLEGAIAAGDTVKLQHKDIGRSNVLDPDGSTRPKQAHSIIPALSA